MKKLIFILGSVLLLQGSTLAQESGSALPAKNGNIEVAESIKPLRLGLKIGTPSAVILNAEYVTPLWNNRVAFAVDYLPITVGLGDIDLKLKNFEIGSNIYFNQKGKGLYGGISYYSFNTEARVIEVEFDDGTFGDGDATLKFNTVNVKLGVKLGKTFYSRFEIGYGFGSLPSEVITTKVDGSATVTDPIEDISVLSASGLPIFNLGFGFSFL
ncbi:MAG: hypothetical protein AAFP76_00665 [Bacteroidota bacterium]